MVLTLIVGLTVGYNPNLLDLYKVESYLMCPHLVPRYYERIAWGNLFWYSSWTNQSFNLKVIQWSSVTWILMYNVKCTIKLVVSIWLHSLVLNPWHITTFNIVYIGMECGIVMCTEYEYISSSILAMPCSASQCQPLYRLFDHS